MVGSRPPGSWAPSRTSASAAPASWPGNQLSSTAGTCARHGSSTGEPELTTTTVCGLAAATRGTSSSWRPGSRRSPRSKPSDSASSVVATTTTATSAPAAALTASLISASASACGARWPRRKCSASGPARGPTVGTNRSVTSTRSPAVSCAVTRRSAGSGTPRRGHRPPARNGRRRGPRHRRSAAAHRCRRRRGCGAGVRGVKLPVSSTALRFCRVTPAGRRPITCTWPSPWGVSASRWPSAAR